MRIPRVACINDISGFGRCSLTTAISIISAIGVQVCPLPTAVLSKHTGFPSYYFRDLTADMPPYIESWGDIEFDGIYSGFLGSAEQISIVDEFIKSRISAAQKPKIIVDPVMGDNGALYPTYTAEMQEKMRILVSHADLAAPNITEACFLTGTKYTGESIDDSAAEKLAADIYKLGCKSVVLTGIVRGGSIINMTFDGESFSRDEIHRESRIFSGTGDIFASVVCGSMLKGMSIPECVKVAGGFISRAAKYTIDLDTPLKEGVVFEPLLHTLSQTL